MFWGEAQLSTTQIRDSMKSNIFFSSCRVLSDLLFIKRISNPHDFKSISISFTLLMILCSKRNPFMSDLVIDRFHSNCTFGFIFPLMFESIVISRIHIFSLFIANQIKTKTVFFTFFFQQSKHFYFISDSIVSYRNALNLVTCAVVCVHS